MVNLQQIFYTAKLAKIVHLISGESDLRILNLKKIRHSFYAVYDQLLRDTSNYWSIRRREIASAAI